MKIYITRHSLTTWNEEKRLQGWKNSDLTKQGLEDAKRLGNYLKNQSFDGIYSSPLKRAKETAQLIFPNKTIIEDDRLKEMNFGDYEGKFIDEKKKIIILYGMNHKVTFLLKMEKHIRKLLIEY